MSSPTNVPWCPRCSGKSPWPRAPSRSARPSPPTSRQRTGRTIATAQVDADNPAETAALIRKTGARLLHQRGAALSGSAPHGRLPGGRLRLPGHRQLRAAGGRQVRVFLAVGVSGALRASRADRAARLGFRPRRDQRVHRLGAQAPVRRDPHARHHRRQRRQPRQGLRHQFQPGDQHPRGHRRVPPLSRTARFVETPPMSQHQAFTCPDGRRHL